MNFAVRAFVGHAEAAARRNVPAFKVPGVGVLADRCRFVAVACYLDAAEWVHAAENDPDLFDSERREWMRNAADLVAVAERKLDEARDHDVVLAALVAA